MRIVSAFTLLLLFLTACQNDPDPTGIGLIPDSDLIGALRFDSQRDSSAMRHATHPYPLTHAASGVLSVGAADGYDSRALLRWLSLPDSIGNGGRIVSATIRLRSLPYHIGNNAGSFRLEAREITSFWNSFTVTYDSLTTLQYETTPAGVFEGILGETDSLDLAIDSTLIRKWLINSQNGDYTRNYGVLLEARASGVVRSFQSLETVDSSPPRLIIIMENAGKRDTVYGATGDDSYILKGEKREIAERIILQSGVSIRGNLYFDVSAIPPASIINYATLYLTKDSDLSTRFYRGADTVLVYENVDSTKNTLRSSGIVSRTDAAMPGVFIADGALLTRAVQNWVNGKGNYGLILLAMNEASDLDRMAIHGTNAPADKRPRLVVTYTSQP